MRIYYTFVGVHHLRMVELIFIPSNSCPLMNITFTVRKLYGNASLHLATWAHMKMVMEC